MAHKGYKFRIYPTEDQKDLLLNTFGACRFVYNWSLAQKTKAYLKDKTNISYNKSSKNLTQLKTEKDFLWLNEVSSTCLQQSLKNLDTAFSRFFKGQSKYPKFHSRKENRGSAKFTTNSFSLKDGVFKIAKCKKPVDVKWSRELPSDPLSCTVSVTPSGKFYVSFLCEVEKQKLPKVESEVGIDFGISAFVTDSHGAKYKLPNSLKKQRAKLKRAQRKHSRKKKGSRNKEKARLKVARLHEKIYNIKTDFLHKLSTKLVSENQAISMEDLNVVGMVKNRKLSRAIHEQGWRQFRNMIEYKSDFSGRQFLLCDRFFPSSKTCSACGKIKDSMSLNIREWTCSCGVTHDRDINAAINILAAGHVVSACGADGRPVKNYVLKGSQRRSRKPKK